MRTRLHHAALHRGQDEARELAPIERARQPRSRRDQARLDRVGPRLEVGGERLAHGRIGLVDLERKTADRARVDALGLHDSLPVAREERKHTLDRIVDAFPRGREQHLVDAAEIAL